MAIVDSRPQGSAAYAGKARLIAGAVVSDARGGKAIASIDIFKDGRTETIQVDALAVAGGFSPVIHLACHRGGKPLWSDAQSAFLAPQTLAGVTLAGAVSTTTGIADCLEQGAAEAATLVSAMGFQATPAAFGTVEGDIVARPEKALWSIPGIKGKAFVDYQNDVTRKDLGLAVQEG